MGARRTVPRLNRRGFLPAAFRTSRLVALGEAHHLQEHHDLLQTLVSGPRLPRVVDDIVVEFGNTLYQDTIDSFVLDGQPVADADLRPVWRNTTQSPDETAHSARSNRSA